MDIFSLGGVILDLLQTVVDFWNDKVSLVFELLGQSPVSFKNGGPWAVVANLEPIFVAVGSSLVVLFFVIGFCSESIDVKEEVRFETILRMLMRIGIAEWLVANNVTIMKAFFTSAGNLVGLMTQGTTTKLKIPGEQQTIIKDLGLESAKNNRYIQDNPCFDIIVPWKRTTSKRRFLTVKEQNDFLESVRTNQSYFYPMIKIMLQTGLRVSEVGGLRWGDIDFKNKVIHVQRALTCNYEYGKKVMRMSPTKTQNSVREIPFMGDVEEQLINQKKQQDQTKENLGERYRSEEGEFTDLVFTTSMGSPMIRHNAQKIITRAVKAYNLEEGARAVQENRVPVYMEPVSPHALRRTFCTRCFEAGINPKVVQSVMGHATYSTTIDIYTEVMGEMKESELAKFTLDVNTKDIINQN